MTASPHTPQRTAATEAQPLATQEWSEAFGDLDLDNDTHDTTKSPSHSSPSSLPTASSSVPSRPLSVVEPLWFLRTDELAATEQWGDDTKSRVREILSFRVDKACWLYGTGRYQEALEVMITPQPLSAQGKLFNRKESKHRTFRTSNSRCVQSLHMHSLTHSP